MNGRRVVACLLLIVTPAAATAGPGDPAPVLSAAQEAEASEIDHLLISPCCWTTSVAVHGSGQAPVMKAEIRRLLAEGRTRSEILDHFVAEYGERILAEPRGSGFNALAYWVPWIALVFGGGIIVAFVKRRRPHAPKQTPPAPRHGDDDRARIDRELSTLGD